MKIIEGTPEEIKEYLDKEKNLSRPVSRPTPGGFGKYLVTMNLKDRARHWSRNKSEWVYIKDMDSSYIINVLRQKLNDDTAISLLDDTEFKSLIINLSDKISN